MGALLIARAVNDWAARLKRTCRAVVTSIRFTDEIPQQAKANRTTEDADGGIGLSIALRTLRGDLSTLAHRHAVHGPDVGAARNALLTRPVARLS